MTAIPLSVLDLSPISQGGTPTDALRNSVRLAQHAESLGYKRFWLAEHHFVAVASSSTPTAIALVTAATDRIRVGAAAVQIGFHTPVSVVEAFGTIDALHPGRLDLGLGRSGQRRAEATAGSAPPRRPTVTDDRLVDGVLVPPPFSAAKQLGSPRMAAAATALLPPPAQQPDFAEAVDDVLALLAGTFEVGGEHFSAVPGEHAEVEVWVFGSSRGQSAEVAGRRGLPFVASYHITPSTALDAVAAYRDAFVPSETLAEPYVVVSADVVVADDDATARELASSFGPWVHSIRAGGGAVPYPDPAVTEPLTEAQQAVVDDRVRTQFVGDAPSVADGLRTLAAATGADELVVTSVTHGFDDRLRSHELLAKEWGLA
ncbi:LLM class flavin-dependent oxidoreductase [Williamsia herbipolensis]|uniref:LLM class flavin-dependent oxidoreductase n=1 Tax=Williamsia herbipolensis TaxID=1603258 RepID=A0AAU4JZT0_9NOCA|nr:LLM class flavin-dependent oxidoreductase [Williamsia herbipolensis]